jgi:hypothetical protein
MKDSTLGPSSYSFYKKSSLWWYNWYVLGFNNRFVWRCPTPKLVDLFLKHSTEHHCDIGVGTGFFLKKTHQKKPFKSLHLIDGSQDCVSWTASLFPHLQITSQTVDVLEGNFLKTQPAPTSISLNYLIHCLHGDLNKKQKLFDNIREIALPGTIVFGSTIAGEGAPHNALARFTQKQFNLKRIFDTSHDSVSAISKWLDQNLSDLNIEPCGSVILFSGKLR